MRNSPAGDPFDAAICMGNSFGYLDISGTRTFLTALAVAIRAAGGLVIDFNAAAESILPGFAAEPREMNTGDITVTATNEYDAVNSRLISRYRYRFRRGGEEQTATAPHHVYTSAHIGQLLTDAGFTDIRRRGGPCGETFTLGDGRLILTARRPPDRPMVSR